MPPNHITTSTTSILSLTTAAIVGASSYYYYYKYAIQRNRQDRHPHTVSVTLPDWAVKELIEHTSKSFTSDEEMMKLAIKLSQMNVEKGTGGPFGTAIFERMPDNTTKLISIGVNRVVPLQNSTLHGEIVAIQMAQSKLKSYTMQIPSEDIDAHGSKRIRQFELFTSCEPCCMCLGAVLWSGISRMVCGATKDDAEAIGFDEGPVYDQSYVHLEKAGVSVTKCVLRDEGKKVLDHYASVGEIYNSTHAP